MPKLIVGHRQFTVSDVAAAPLVRADILYWDTAGESMPRQPHLHLNPMIKGFDALERAVAARGPAALPTRAEAFRQAKRDPDGHPFARL